MDVSLRAPRPFGYNYNININNSNNNQSLVLNSRHFIGFLSYKPSYRFSHSHSWRINNPSNGILRAFSASGDFSRKRPKKWSSPGSKGRGRKGFGTKPQVGTASQKKDQKKAEDNTKPSSSRPELDNVEPDKSVFRVSQLNGSEEKWISESNRMAEEPSSSEKGVAVATQYLLREVDSVKGFLVEGESSADTGEGDEEFDDDEINSAFENYEKTEAKEHFAQSEILGLEETTDSDILFETSADLEDIREDLMPINYQSSEDGNYATETEELGLITRVSDEAADEKDVNNQSVEPDLISETKVVESALTAPDIVTSEEEAEDLVSLSLESESEVASTTADAVTSEEDTEDSMSSNIESGKNVAENDVLVPVESELTAPDAVTSQEDIEDSTSSSMESVKIGAENDVLVPVESELTAPDAVTSEEDIEDLVGSNIASGKNVAESDVSESADAELTSSDAVTSEDIDAEDLVSSESIESDNIVAENDTMESVKSEFTPPDVATSEEKEVESDESVSESDVVESESTNASTTDMKELEDSVQKLVLEKQAEEALIKMELEREALRKQAIEQLAEENLVKGNRVFVYPVSVKPDEDIEVFYNRSLSCLRNEPDVVIMGAFNDWKWKQFGMKMEKTQLVGDWWSCKIHVPKEAYKMDYVFNNGKEVYDNNNTNDFHVIVEGGMDVSDFEDFLLEEKHREVEVLAREEAERKREAEEERRIEKEKAASEADRLQARAEVENKREMVKAFIGNASTTMENVWFFKPNEFDRGDSVRLYYNRGSGPLSQAQEIWVHGGYNGWQNGVSIVAKLEKSAQVDADWWYAQVTVPDQAIVLDWVFADGPPQQALGYDNNKQQDFHGIVPLSVPDEAYWVEEEVQIYQRLQDERRAQEEAKRVKAEKTARMRAETKEQTLKTFLLSQRHIVYTEPLDIQAGKDVTVYYNPSNTVLNGKPEVWFRCSFNRWTHREGPLAPIKMLLAENGSHVKTTVKVPCDAYMMDFVFSESKEGGIFDNKNNMDYHIPVFGGIAREPPMHIVHIAVEMAPIAKVGGLGDVVTSLSRAIQDLNHHVDIILPKYDCINTNHVEDLHYQRSFPWGGAEIKVWSGKVEGLNVYFLEPLNGLFWTGCVYAGRNDGHRFGFFCHAALEFLFQSGLHPDIIHCHDWSSAPVTWLYKDHYRQCGLSKARVVFTIHNLEFGANLIGKAMAFADKATTVSGTYSKEVAGNPAIAPHLYKFHGILNGIDPDIWDPYNDKFIPVSYTSENVAEGKQAAKEMLQQRLSIRKADVPLVGIISRLTHQKGIHLIKHAIWRTIERGGQVVLLGSAPDPRIQQEFVDLSNQMHNLHSDRGRLVLTYDEPLSHLIYAGADFILVPSIFEPCGLTQLVAMRYGAIPVVRKTGGLYDTVFDVDHDQERARAHGLEPNGFSFEGADHGGVDYALNRAISAWYDGKEWLNSLRKRVMEQDWSWNRPALEYMELYHAARKN